MSKNNTAPLRSHHQSEANRPARPRSAHIQDVEVIPLWMRNLEAWVCWQWRWKPAKGRAKAKWDKPPINPNNGLEVDAINPDNWMTFDDARKAALAAGLDGIGFALGSADGRTGLLVIDLDDCIDDQGVINELARGEVERFNSYTERTPSEHGLRILTLATKPVDNKCATKTHPGIELYQQDRYICVTGRHLEGTSTAVAQRDQELAELYFTMWPKLRPAKLTSKPKEKGANGTFSDDELIQKARESKNGDRFRSLFDQGDDSAYPSQSEADMALMNDLAFWLGCDANRMELAFSRSALGQRDKWAKADYRKRTIEKAIGDCRSTYDPPRSSNGDKPHREGDPPDKRPVIFVTTEEYEVNDQAINALCQDACLDLYQRNLKLVAIAWDTRPKSGDTITRAEGTPLIRPIQAARLREDLTRVAAWKTWSKPDRKGQSKPIKAHPPSWSVNAILARENWPNVRHLVGIVESPTLRPDGSVIETRGFDETTGLLYVPNDTFPAIPAKPTQTDASAAAALLFKLVKDFPFKTGHKAAWLAALLTPLARFLIDGPCPMFLFEANTSGAGKSLLCDLIAIISTGRVMTRTRYSHDPVEMDKQITSTALAGDRVVLFDNLTNGGRLGNSALDGALTGRTYRGRILGRLEMTPDLDLVCVFYVTGNNVQLCGDVVRRIVPCRLESPMERPEERDDFTIKNILSYVAQKRGQIVKAALTILRGFILAGKPDQKLTPMDFPAWSNLIRNAVHWATELDPCIGRKDLAGSNPEREHAAALVQGWYLLQLGKNVGGMTSAEVLKYLNESPAEHYTMLRDALASLWPKTKAGELPSAGSIGTKIQAIRGQVFNGRRFEAMASENRAKIWSVSIVGGANESNESNESLLSRGRAEQTNDKSNRDNSQSVNQNVQDGKQTHQTHQTHSDEDWTKNP